MDTTVLENIGLSKKEIKIYLALLKLKSAPVMAIAQESGVDRSQSYDILEKLMHRGLASFVIKSNAKYFNPVDPKQLFIDFKQNEKKLQQLLLQLSNLYAQPSEKVTVEIFKGKEGIKTILKIIIRTKSNYDMIGAPQFFETLFPIYSKQFLRDMEKNKIKERIIYTKKGKFIKIKMGEYRYLSEMLYSPIDAMIFNNQVAIIIWTEPCYGILIKSQDVFANYRRYFDFLWKLAKPV